MWLQFLSSVLFLWSITTFYGVANKYKDDALKFRIIRVWRGCSPKKILCLSDVLDIHRDATIIKRIKKQTDNYNLELKAKADSLMQNNLQKKKSKQDWGYKTFDRGENISSILFFIQEYLLYLQTIRWYLWKVQLIELKRCLSRKGLSKHGLQRYSVRVLLS